MPADESICPLCLESLQEPMKPLPNDTYKFRCRRCGNYIITRTAVATMHDRNTGDPKIPILGHFVRRMQLSEDYPTLNSDTIKRIFETGELPSPAEQADNLLRYVAEMVAGPSEDVMIRPDEVQFIVGSKTPVGIVFLLKALSNEKLLLDVVFTSDGHRATPTLQGWQRYEELRRGISSSRKVFMALKFGNADLDHLVDRHFRPAVTQAGFTLFRLDDEPKAGSIDDRLRVEIQTSRFMIADLTHANNGVYWEAGYAEGLQKPVIYTCHEDAFDKIHFDTSHLLTVK